MQDQKMQDLKTRVLLVMRRTFVVRHSKHSADMNRHLSNFIQIGLGVSFLRMRDFAPLDTK